MVNNRDSFDVCLPILIFVYDAELINYVGQAYLNQLLFSSNIPTKITLTVLTYNHLC